MSKKTSLLKALNKNYLLDLMFRSVTQNSVETALKDISHGIENGFDINDVEKGPYNNSIPHFLIVNELKEKALAVINKFHAEINFKLTDTTGTTILLLSLKTLQTDIATLILSFDKSSIDIRDSKGRTPLHIAYILGLDEIRKTLLAAGANPNLKDSKGLIPSEYLQGHEKDISDVLDSVSIDHRRHPAANVNWFMLKGQLYFLTDQELMETNFVATKRFKTKDVHNNVNTHGILLCNENAKIFLADIKEYFKDQTQEYRSMLIAISKSPLTLYGMCLEGKSRIQNDISSIETVNQSLSQLSLPSSLTFFSSSSSTPVNQAEVDESSKAERKIMR